MIKIENLNKSFKDNHVLIDLSLEIKPGLVYGLIGPNGAGKSTLMRCLANIYQIDSGYLSVDEIPLSKVTTTNQKIFYVSDQPFFLKSATLKEMRKFYQIFYPKFDDSFYYYLLTKFELDEEALLNTYSKGMKRQAAIILGLATRPNYLLLDEAFDGLDPVVRTTFKSLLIKLIDENSVTVIISSHNLRELEDICDSFGLLDHCEISTSGDIEESKEMISKYQLAFENGIPEEIYHDFNILHHKATGRVLTIVVKGNKDEIINRLKKYNPLMIDYLNVDFEELFIYEVESRGLNNE